MGKRPKIGTLSLDIQRQTNKRIRQLFWPLKAFHLHEQNQSKTKFKIYFTNADSRLMRSFYFRAL